MAVRHRKTGEKENVLSRRLRVMELRREGKSVRKISEILLKEGWQSAARATVGQDLKLALADLIQETLEESQAVRALELDRLDEMYAAIHPKLSKGDFQAIDRALRISQRRAALLGLDQTAPQNINLNLSGLSDEELRAIAEGKKQV